jgi:hypothetical protein
MPYGATDMTQTMGVGNYVGELRRGPDGHLYQWVSGVDGLGNPIGFWKRAFKFVTGAAQRFARAGLARLIPGPIKRLARRACGVVDQLGPAVTAIPIAAPYYAGAKGFCKVLRGSGIADVDYGVMEVPAPVSAAVTAAIPGPARAAAKTVCGIVNRLGPVMRYIPIAGSYYKKATGLCRVLRDAGIAGVEGGLMEAPDGQLYEVVEGLGEFGERRRYLRQVKLVIPAYIGARGRAHRRGAMQTPPVRPTAPPTAPPAAVSGFGRLY